MASMARVVVKELKNKGYSFNESNFVVVAVVVCLAAEFWTGVRRFLRPGPDVVHFILTHFSWVWDIVNSTYLRDVLMRLVLKGSETARKL